MNTTIRIVKEKIKPDDFTEEDLIQAPDAFFTEIEALDILETSDNDDILNLLCSKVRKGGKLHLSGFDGMLLCKEVASTRISLQEASNIIKPIKRFNSLLIIKEYLSANGWKILFAGMNGMNRYLLQVTK